MSINEKPPGDIYFPPTHGKWETVDPKAVGWNAKTLEAALQFAGEHHSSGMVILYRGRIMAERYWDLQFDDTGDPNSTKMQAARFYRISKIGHDKEKRPIEDVTSTQKSIVAALACIAQEKGLISFDDPVEVHMGESWSNAPRDKEKKITIRHLMTMTSGLTETLEYNAPTGTHWHYNTTAYQQIMQILCNASKMHRNDLMMQWLAGPIGMTDTTWIERKWAPLQGKVPMLGLATTVRDLARFGILVLNGGSWDGDIIINPECLGKTLRSSQELNRSYGYLWWLNCGPSFLMPGGVTVIKGKMIPTAPDDTVSALGALDRKLWVTPSLGVVVCRMGSIAKESMESAMSSFDNEFWKLLMMATPAC